MDVTKIIDLENRLGISLDVIDFTRYRTKNGTYGTRVTLGSILNKEVVEKLKKIKKVHVADGICTYKYAPEIKHSYFYIDD